MKHKIWYPYTQHKKMGSPLPIESAHGVHLTLRSGERLVDAISSWWCVIHGYQHPALNAVLEDQLHTLPHVMLGGLTHEPAATLANTLCTITPEGLDHVFYGDSGSVGCEIALKMALQYWMNKQRPEKSRFLALNKAYHGDTFGVMAVSNPEDDCPSMHHLFGNAMPRHLFYPEPALKVSADMAAVDQAAAEFKAYIQRHQHEIAAFICEPMMQGAGGFNMYSAAYLRAMTQICQEHEILVIFDEVATGFGRTGSLFAANQADVTPDIMVLGKALTAGYCGHSATLCTSAVYDAFYSDASDHAFMHGPTFMGNPLACRVANESILLFQRESYLDKIKQIESTLANRLLHIKHEHIKDTRVLGATGVIEVHDPEHLAGITEHARQRGVWLRPFDRYVYTTPPYIISNAELEQVCDAMTSFFN